jgi:hypothetical protein
MRETPIILQDVIVFGTLRQRDLLRDRHGICEIFVWKFVEFLRMVWMAQDEPYAGRYEKNRHLGITFIEKVRRDEIRVRYEYHQSMTL